MLPSAQATTNISGYTPAVQAGFSAGPAFTNQPGFLSSEQNIHQGGDPNSPAAFHKNLQIVQERVLHLQNLARNTLAAMRANPVDRMLTIQATAWDKLKVCYLGSLHDCSRSVSQVSLLANLGRLKQEIEDISQLMLQSGVGALPLLPIPAPDEGMPRPTEQQLLTEVNTSIRLVFEQMKRSQDSAAVVANLLGAPDRSSK
ncbi:hypothetical protein C0992_007515 [Termitomyces sp. T32_za158]|nr:hypothetical protein C0992_007515 [Termitomyces sp. T32_za158]